MRQALVAATVAILMASGQAGFAQQSVVDKHVRDLESNKMATRLQAATALGLMGKGASIAAADLKWVVEHEPDSKVALQAIQALTQIGAHRQLQRLLLHQKQHVRMQALMGLAVIGPPAKKAVPELLRLLDDDQPGIRSLAAQALSEIGLEGEAETRGLIKLLADPVPGVRPYANMALMNLGPASVPALEKVLADSESIEVRVASLQALAIQGPSAKPAVPTLIKLLKDPDPIIRAQSASTLAAIGPDASAALPALLDALLDRKGEVQALAFRAALAVSLNDRRALSTGLKNANAKGRWAAGQIADNNPVPALIKNLSDKKNSTRIAAALALGQIGKEAEPAIPHLTRMLKDENKQVQNAARQALAQLDYKNAEAYFVKLRTDHEQFVRDAMMQQAKFAADMAKIVNRTQMELQQQQMEFLQVTNPRAWVRLRQLTLGQPQTMSLAIRNGARQAYLRQVLMMHLVYSSMDTKPPASDWVRDQITNMGVEAVPALLDAYNLSIRYSLGFC